MTITFSSLLLFLAIIQLLLASLNINSIGKKANGQPVWVFFPGGMLFWAISLFVTVAVR
jgi:hypothetical protein